MRPHTHTDVCWFCMCFVAGPSLYILSSYLSLRIDQTCTNHFASPLLFVWLDLTHNTVHRYIGSYYGEFQSQLTIHWIVVDLIGKFPDVPGSSIARVCRYL